MQEQTWKVIEDWAKKNERVHDKRTVFPHLVEEVGELAREYNNSLNNWREEFDKEKFSKELVDVITHCLLLAQDFEVDIDEVFKKKMIDWRKRFNLS